MNEEFLAMRSNFTLLVAISVSAFIALQLYLKIWQRPERSISLQWSGSILLLLALIVLVDDVASRIDYYTGINNLSWFVGYTSGTIMLFIFAYSWADDDIYTQSQTIQQGIYVSALFVVAVMTAIYATEIITTPEWIARTPRSAAELIFSLCFFGTGAIISVFGLLSFYTAFRRETNPAVRIRLGYASLLTIITIAFFIAKVLFVMLSYYSGGYKWVDQFALQIMALIGLLFPLLLIPGKYYQWVVMHNPVAYLRHLHTFLNLRELELYLDELLQTERTRTFPKRYMFSNLRLSIYRTVIAILDNRKILHSAVDRDSTMAIQNIDWSTQQQQRANKLNHYLQEVDSLDTDNGNDLDQVALLLVEANQKIRSGH